MCVICIGPCCIPLHLLLPFLLSMLHQYGYMKWIKREYVTFKYWKNKVLGGNNAASPTDETKSCCADKSCVNNTTTTPNEEEKKKVT